MSRLGDFERKYVIFEVTDLNKSDLNRHDNNNEYLITLRNIDGQLFYSFIRPNSNVNLPYKNGIFLKQDDSGYTEQSSNNESEFKSIVKNIAQSTGTYYYGFKKPESSSRGGQSATFRQRNPKRRTRRATRRRRV